MECTQQVRLALIKVLLVSTLSHVATTLPCEELAQVGSIKMLERVYPKKAPCLDTGCITLGKQKFLHRMGAEEVTSQKALDNSWVQDGSPAECRMGV